MKGSVSSIRKAEVIPASQTKYEIIVCFFPWRNIGYDTVYFYSSMDTDGFNPMFPKINMERFHVSFDLYLCIPRLLWSNDLIIY